MISIGLNLMCGLSHSLRAEYSKLLASALAILPA